MSEGLRKRATEREGERSGTNEHVFNVNFAHKAYCNDRGETLHFFSRANMPTCNQQTERDRGRHLIHLQNVHNISLNGIIESKNEGHYGRK